MGGRRKANKIQKRDKPLLVKTIFDCRLCGFKNCVNVKIKKVVKSAHLLCTKCGQDWDTPIRGMDEAIDVYHKWIIYLKNTKIDPQPRQLPQFEEHESNSLEDVYQMVKGVDKGVDKKLNDDMSEQISEDSLNEQPLVVAKQQIGRLKKEMDDDSFDISNSIPKQKIEQGPIVKQPIPSDDDEEDVFSMDSLDEPQPNKKVKVEN